MSEEYVRLKMDVNTKGTRKGISSLFNVIIETMKATKNNKFTLKLHLEETEV